VYENDSLFGGRSAMDNIKMDFGGFIFEKLWSLFGTKGSNLTCHFSRSGRQVAG